MTPKQAEIIKAGIEGAMDEAKKSASDVRDLARRVAEIGKQVQRLAEQVAKMEEAD